MGILWGRLPPNLVVAFLNANPFPVDGRSLHFETLLPRLSWLRKKNMATEFCWKEGIWWLMTSDCRLGKTFIYIYVYVFLMWQCWWCNKKPSGHVVVSSSTHIRCPNTSEPRWLLSPHRSVATGNEWGLKMIDSIAVGSSASPDVEENCSCVLFKK